MRVALLAALACALNFPSAPAAAAPPKAQILIVGVAHLVAKADLHNATWGAGALSPAMQTQIKLAIQQIARFKPTKVMIEADAANPAYVRRYKEFLNGRYSLGANENDQFGYRLAAMEHNPTIYPVDARSGFPFDYSAVQASAKANDQGAILAAADAHVQPFLTRVNRLEKQNRVLDVLRYINTASALAMNASWYMYVDRIGNARSDYAGANLVSFWYARNLHIFANIMRSVGPGDRIVIFIGQGHAAILRPLATLSPDLQVIDAEAYLK